MDIVSQLNVIQNSLHKISRHVSATEMYSIMEMIHARRTIENKMINKYFKLAAVAVWIGSEQYDAAASAKYNNKIALLQAKQKGILQMIDDILKPYNINLYD